MSPKDSDANQFPQTRWSLIRRAGALHDNARNDSELEVLLRRYMPALLTYLRQHMDILAADAEDLLQSFVADKVVASNLVGSADQARGRFRTYLLCILRNFVLERQRSDRAACRRPASLVPLSKAPDIAAREAPPSEQFDIEWARQTIEEATQRMRAECQVLGRPDIWTIFDRRVIRPAFDGDPPAPYEDLVAELKLTSPVQACNLLVTGKRMFSRCLCEVVGEYAETEDLEEEIGDLRTILALAAKNSGGRAGL